MRTGLNWVRRLLAAPGRAPALALLALLVIVRALDPSVVQSLRLRGFDFIEHLAPRAYEPLPVVIVAIDDKSLAQYGQWPWSRALVAQLVDKIAAGKPSVLGVDIIFAEPDRLSPERLPQSDPEIPAQIANELSRLPTHESVLVNAMHKVPTVLAVGASEEAAPAAKTPARVTMVLESGGDPRPFLSTYPTLLRSLPEIEAGERGEGTVNMEPHNAGVTRRVPLFIVAQGNLVPDLASAPVREQSASSAEQMASRARGSVRSFFRPTCTGASIHISRRRTTRATSRRLICSAVLSMPRGSRARL